MSIGSGFFFSPFYASAVARASSYEATCESVAFILLVFMVVFLAIQLCHTKEEEQFEKNLKEPLHVSDIENLNK